MVTKENDLSESNTLPKLLVEKARGAGTKVAMLHKDLGIWKEYTWNDYLREVKYFSLGLKRLGFNRGDKISIVGDNEPEWYWAELAAQSLGGIVAGVFSDSVASEIQYIVDHSDSVFVVASDQEQVDKLLEIRDRLPQIKRIIFWDYKGLDNYDAPILISWKEVRDLGREYDREAPNVFMQEVLEGREEDVCLILYTSGTGGQQKGAIRSHHNMIYSALREIEELKITDVDRRLSFYSPAWISEQLEGISVSLVSGQVTFFPENPDTAVNDLREVGQTVLFTGSRIWEELASTIQVRIEDASWFKRFIYKLFLPVGRKMADLLLNNKKPKLEFRLLHRLADMIVFARLRDRVGLLKLRAGITMGALLSPDAFGYFWALGIPIRQAYGLSELAPVTMHRSNDIDQNTVGPPLSSVDLKISDEGEILARDEDRVFLGYHKNPRATENAMRDGWLHTGDCGFINEKGHLIFFDRLDNTVTLKTGQKLAPQYLESRLKFSPYINDAIVLGGENYDNVSVIIDMQFANVSKWADKHRIHYLTFADLSQKDEVYELIDKEIKRINRSLPEALQIKRFVNLYKQLDPDEAELTRTRKVRRKFFEEKYKPIIDALHGENKTIEVETEVKYRDGKKSMIRTMVQIRDV